MKLSTICLAVLAGSSTALASSVRINIKVQDDKKVSGVVETAVLNAHCNVTGTDQKDAEIDIAAAISEIFDTKTEPSPWASAAPCSSDSNTTSCLLTAIYVEQPTCGAMCQGKIRIEARRVAKQNNSKVFCYYGVDKASALAIFDWKATGSLVNGVQSVVNKVEEHQAVSEELK